VLSKHSIPRVFSKRRSHASIHLPPFVIATCIIDSGNANLHGCIIATASAIRLVIIVGRSGICGGALLGICEICMTLFVGVCWRNGGNWCNGYYPGASKADLAGTAPCVYKKSRMICCGPAELV
jgi:hypothetical protein